MNVSLTNLYSLINGYTDAKDRERVFTFIEFIKEFGFENSSDIILSLYREYLILWANTKKRNDFIDDEEYVKEALTDTLKTITLSYSSYEEQDFLANIDWQNIYHKRAIIPFFARKIKEICDFYKQKRQDISQFVDKNKFRGTRRSIEEIIYEKIIDFYFTNKNQIPQIAELQRNLIITLEEYVDVYSEYFDIPHKKKCNDKTRAALLSANINDVNYADYLEVSQVVADMIYSGEIYLNEIPLIAQVGLDLSAHCTGDLENLRQELLNNATLNQVSLSEQIAIRRKLYEKLLGCDLYYIYSDENKNLQSNLLVKAQNPSGNLLNCGSADMALVESEQVKLISHIGLFFKPDKLGILKVHADNFVWEVDMDKIKPDTFYVFPEPGKYGDIGANKDINYPLVYEYKLDSVIKNLSSGVAKDEPLAYLSSMTWGSYYSKQYDDFKLIDNKNFNHSFTSLANTGLLESYQIDMFGNEYGLFKGFHIDSENNILTVPDIAKFPEIQYVDSIHGDSTDYNKNRIINGGYFTDPRWPSDKNRLGRQFNYAERLRILKEYIWTGIITKPQTFFTPDVLSQHLNFGSFENSDIYYADHYLKAPSITGEVESGLEITTNVFESFVTDIADEMTVIKKEYNLRDLKHESGILYFYDKALNTIQLIGENIKKYVLNGETLIICKENLIEIYRYIFDDSSTKFILVNTITISPGSIYEILYNEREDKFLILTLDKVNNNFNLSISEYIPSTRKLEQDKIVYNETKDSNFECILTNEMPQNCSFMYNNNINGYILSYIINGIDDIPYLYVHTFKLFDQEQFDSTLNSTCYSARNNNDGYCYIFEKTISKVEFSSNINNIPFFIPNYG